jgi:two-component system OmpR family response regulator
LSTHIKHIRRKLKLIDQSFDALINVYGTGYRWESPPG